MLTWLALVVLALVALRLAGGGGSAGDRGAAMHADPGDPDGAAYRVIDNPERTAAAAQAEPVDLDRGVEAIEAGAVEAVVYDNDGSVYLRTESGPWLRVEGGWTTESTTALSRAGLPFETLHDVAWDTGALRTTMGGDAVIDSLGALLAPLLLLLGLLVALVWWLKRRQGQAGGILQLRKSPARTLEPVSHLTFSDVGGLDEVKSRLQDVIDVLKEPERWTRAGVRPPRGVLLEGPPGCGKTLLARAVAGEAGVPVFVISATDLVEMFVGVGAARVRDTFEKARKQAPAVLFIDELDAVGRRRGTGMQGMAHDEREQTLNQLLVSLDGAEQAAGDASRLVVIAATNRADILDKALLRPGRFDIRLEVPTPDPAGREAVLAVHAKRLRLDPGVRLPAVAARAEGLTGAELELAINEAALRAARRDIRGEGTPLVTPEDLDQGLRAARRAVDDFDAVDALMVESGSQLSRPRGGIRARLHLEGGEPVEGRLLWADPLWIKIADADGERLVPKSRLLSLESLAGTDAVDPDVLPAAPGPVGVA